MHQRGAPDRIIVGLRELAEGRVNEQVDLARNDQVDRVGPSLVHLRHALGGNPARAQVLLRALGCENPEPHLVEPPHDRQDRRLVGVVDRHEDGPGEW